MRNKLIKKSVAVLIAATVCFSSFCVTIQSMAAENEENALISRTAKTILGSPKFDYSGKKVGILTPPDKPEYYGSVVNAVKTSVNATVSEIVWDDAAREISAGEYEVIVMPEAEKFPENASSAIDGFLANGGKLLTMGGPPLQSGEEKVNGAWLNRDEAFKSAEKKTILNFSNSQDRQFTLVSDNLSQLNYTMGVESGAPDGGSSIHVTYGNPQNWAQLEKNVSVNMSGASSIAFYLKGNEAFYTGLSVGIGDGTNMYYATVKPSSDWKLVSLSEQDFNLWADATIHYDVHPDFDTVKKVSFGIAQTHTPFHMGMLHEFYITSPVLQRVSKLGETDIVLDGIAPEYKFFPITNGKTAEASQNQSLVATRDYQLPEELFSPVHRPQGTGYLREKACRFVPLIEVNDEKGLRSGYLAWMFVHSTARSGKADSKYEGSIIAGFGTSDNNFYNQDGQAAVVDVIRAMLNDCMFVEAGATEDIYVESETSTLSVGCNIRVRQTSGITVNFEFIKNEKSIAKETFDLSAQRVLKSKGSIEIRSKEFEYKLSRGKPDYIVITVVKDNKVLDTVIHDIRFWTPKAESERKYFTVENNEFIRDGKVFRAYGVNFMPTTAMGMEDDFYWEHYLSFEAFDPDVIYNDLLRMKEIGFNAISAYIYYTDAIKNSNMLWLADTCDKLGLAMNIDIRPHADPFSLSEKEVEAIFNTQHLADFDNVICFDIAWERSLGTYEGNYGNESGRKAYDKDWVQWVKDNYGSVGNAQNIWGEAIPTNQNGDFTGVSDAQLRLQSYSKLVSAYRRFAEDLVASKYAYVKELFTRLAPNHLISARAGNSGCMPTSDPAQMGYDFAATSAGLDFLSPEYYQPINDVEQAIFTNTYARYASSDAPVVWKEFTARSLWSGSNFDKPEHRTLSQKIESDSVDKFRNFMDTIISAHSGGYYHWFSAGGYRYNEKSDCGVINPDGSDRAVTILIREYRDNFLNQTSLATPTKTISIDKNLYSNGMTGVYSAVKDELLSAVESGETVAFYDQSTGKTTETVSDEALSGGIASSRNPAKWVNGVFGAVYVKQSDGSWKQIKYGDNVKIAKGALKVKVVIKNLLGTEWLSKSALSTNYVSLVSTERSRVSFDIPLSRNVRHNETITQEFTLADSVSDGMTVSFRLGIHGRFPFASPFSFTVENENPNAVTWDFTNHTGFTQRANLSDIPVSMPGLSGSYGSQQWILQDDMGLMTVSAGVFQVNVPTNAEVKFVYSGSGTPTIKVAPTPNGPWAVIDGTPVLKDGVYILSIDHIGEENSVIRFEYPHNSGWGGYSYCRLKSFSFKPPKETVWNFMSSSKKIQATDLSDMPVSMPGLVKSNSSAQWITDTYSGLMTAEKGSFVVNVPENSSLRITYSGLLPTVLVADSPNGSFIPIYTTPIESNGVTTLLFNELGVGNRYVKYEFPENTGTAHKLRTFAYKQKEDAKCDFTWIYDYTQASDLNSLPEKIPGLVSEYGSQAWICQDKYGLMTVGAGVFISKVPLNAALDITFSGNALPQVQVGPSAGGPWTELDATPVLKNGVYTLSVDAIGIDNCYVHYTFPENSGWDGYAKHCLRTFGYKRHNETVWNFLENPSWKQSSDLKKMPFEMTGLIDGYNSEQWASDANMGLMTVYGGSLIAKVPADAKITFSFAGNGMPTVSVAPTERGPWQTVSETPMLKNGVYTLSVDRIGAENRFVKYTFGQNGGWEDYDRNSLRAFSYSKPEDIVWNFLDNSSWKQGESLTDMPFNMPELVGGYDSTQWVSDANMGLMTVYGGNIITKIPTNGAVTFTFSGNKMPTVSVASKKDGPYQALNINPVLNNGVYTLTLNGIGIGKSFVKYSFPSNNGWNDYAVNCLRSVTFKKQSLIKNPNADDLVRLKRMCLGIEDNDFIYDLHTDGEINILDLIAMKKLIAAGDSSIRDEAKELKLTNEVFKRSVLNNGNTARLARVLKKAENKEKIVIGTIGGSITQGTAATTEANTYAGRFRDWWKSEYPDTPIEFYNVGKGATTSLMGAHRVGRELLDKNPDLVIVDFSVNDSDDSMYAESYESLLRQILSDENSPAVICLMMMDKRGWNTEPYHLPVAKHYDLPVISYQQALWPKGGEKLYEWSELSPDDIHPNDIGHAIINELLINYITNVRKDLSVISDVIPAVSEPLTANSYANARLINSKDVTPIQMSGFWSEVATYQFPYGWMTISGGTLTVELKDAKNIYLMYESLVSGNGGTVSVSVDGKAPITVSADRIVEWGDCAQAVELLKGTTAGNHTVTVTVTSKAPKDKFTVLGFLVS